MTQQREMTQSREMTPPRTKVVLQNSLSFQLHRLLRILKLYCIVASSQPPAPQILRVLKLYYKVASSQLLAAQVAPRTTVVLQSR